MKIFLYKKNLIENCETINKPVVNRKSPTFHLPTSVTKKIPAPGREKLNT